MSGVILITNTYPESCFIDYIKALVSGDHYQLMPKKIRVKELQTKRGKKSYKQKEETSGEKLNRFRKYTDQQNNIMS